MLSEFSLRLSLGSGSSLQFSRHVRHKVGFSFIIKLVGASDPGALPVRNYSTKSCTWALGKKKVIRGYSRCQLFIYAAWRDRNGIGEHQVSEYVILYANYSLTFPTNSEEMHYLSFILLQKSESTFKNKQLHESDYSCLR